MTKSSLFFQMLGVAILTGWLGNSPLLARAATSDYQLPISQSPSATPASQTVTIANFAFSPSNLTIQKGESVTWINHDSATHTVTSSGAGPLESGPLAQGQSYQYTFKDSGTFTYHCSIHPMMTGAITVVAAAISPTTSPLAESSTSTASATAYAAAVPSVGYPTLTTPTPTPTAMSSPMPTSLPTAGPPQPTTLPVTGPEIGLGLTGSLLTLTLGSWIFYYWQTRRILQQRARNIEIR